MTTKERLEAVMRAVAIREQETTEQEQKREAEVRDALVQVYAVQDEIKDILLLAREALRHGYDLPNEYFGNRCDRPLVADGCRHNVGIMNAQHAFVTVENTGRGYCADAVGFYRGGACGPWDFYVTEDSVYCRHEKTRATREPSLEDLKRFLHGYRAFKTDFYKWFDETFPG